MPTIRGRYISPEQVSGYIPVPGFGQRRLPDLPGGMYSIATRGRTSRRMYNPSFAPGDPIREIGDATYYRLLREANVEEEGIRQQALEARRRRVLEEQEVLQQRVESQSRRQTPEQATLQYEYLSDLDYQARNTSPQAAVAMNAPGGVKANQLELMQLRPTNAPWRVGATYFVRTPDGQLTLTPAGQAMRTFRAQRDIEGLG